MTERDRERETDREIDRETDRRTERQREWYRESEYVAYLQSFSIFMINWVLCMTLRAHPYIALYYINE